MTSNKETSIARNCAYCNSEEGQPRKVGNYIVELQEVRIEKEFKLACQGCRVKYRNERKLRETLSKERVKEMGWLSKISSRLVNQH